MYPLSQNCHIGYCSHDYNKILNHPFKEKDWFAHIFTLTYMLFLSNQIPGKSAVGMPQEEQDRQFWNCHGEYRGRAGTLQTSKWSCLPQNNQGNWLFVYEHPFFIKNIALLAWWMLVSLAWNHVVLDPVIASKVIIKKLRLRRDVVYTTSLFKTLTMIAWILTTLYSFFLNYVGCFVLIPLM